MSEENTNQSRAAVDPGIGGGGIGGGKTIKLYNNSGKTELVSYPIGANDTIINVTQTGLYLSTGYNATIYTYSGSGKFLGVSTTANKTIPDYPIGSTYSTSLGVGNINLYLVSFEYKRVKVEYDGKVLGTVTKGSPLTLKCADKIMKSNVTITKT